MPSLNMIQGYSCGRNKLWFNFIIKISEIQVEINEYFM